MASITPEDINHIIRSRRSTYPQQFSGEKVDRKVVESLIENATWAPNHKHTEPWRFKVFEGEPKDRLLETIRDVSLNALPENKNSEARVRKFEMKKEKTSHLVAIVVSYDLQKRLPQWEELAAVSCAVQNIYLSLESYGVAGYWSTDSAIQSPEFEKHLMLEENEQCIGLFYLGKPGEVESVSQRQSAAAKMEWFS